MPEPSLPGELVIIGLGPGAPGLLAPDALAALCAADTVIGYSGYVSLIDPAVLRGKTIVTSGMRAEVDRCGQALDAARAGAKICLVCSGDPGVYAMAGLVMEILHARGLTLADAAVTVVPGIPAVCAAAALLGAPLTHDFACVSLSDLLTPWKVIEKRLEHAFAADFVLALYNPRSQKRPGHLARALDIAGRHRDGATPLGHVRNAYRPDQEVSLTTLRGFDPLAADMFSIIIVGNGATVFLPAPRGGRGWQEGARMYTPRGYKDKYRLE